MHESGGSSTAHDRETTGRANDYPVSKGRSPLPPPLTDHIKGRSPVPPPLTDHAKGRIPVPPPLTDHIKGRSLVAPPLTDHTEGRSLVAPPLTDHTEGRIPVTAAVDRPHRRPYPGARPLTDHTEGRIPVAPPLTDHTKAGDLADPPDGASSARRKSETCGLHIRNERIIRCHKFRLLQRRPC